MKTKEAFEYILENDKAANKYRLAKSLGCSHTTIANYVSGKRPISFELYKKFKNIYPSIDISDVQQPREYTLGVLDGK